VTVLGLAALTVLLIFGFLQAPQDSNGARPVLSTFNVVLLGIFLYILLPAMLILNAGTYTWAVDYYSGEVFEKTVWLSTLGVGAFVYGNLFSRRRVEVSEAEVASHGGGAGQTSSTRSSASLVMFGLLAAGIALKLVLILDTGGFAESVTRLSDGVRQFSGVESLDAGAILLVTMSGIADGAATWGSLRALRERRLEKAWLSVLLITLGLTYLLTGKRLVILLPIMVVLVGFHVYRRPLTTRVLPIAIPVAIVLGFLTLSARVFLPAAIAGYNMDLNNIAYADGSVLQFYLYSLEFASVEMISVAVEARPDVLEMFGGAWNAMITTNFESFLYSVPRAVWPGKPTVFYDLSHGITAALGATPFEDPTVGYASTLIGTSFIMGGVIGTLVAMLLLGILTARLDRRLQGSSWSDGSIVLYALALVVVFHLFRQGTLGWTFIVSVVQNYGVLLALLVLCILAKEKRSSLLPRANTSVKK
jgi:hypothetical protein